jgi:hypothetical protein
MEQKLKNHVMREKITARSAKKLKIFTYKLALVRTRGACLALLDRAFMQLPPPHGDRC